ncbi:MAG: hypothetical protein H7339_03400 [Arcicella sp.]|nr:hypothetical protein [Arcicella sp.]
MNTMEFKKVLSSGILGTTAMTIFSYVVSEVKREDFREPEIMSLLFKNLSITFLQYGTYLGYLAWIIHYIIGFSFVFIYVKLWDNNKLKPNFISGIFLGAITGIIGIIGWYITLRIHPNPPTVNLRNFFILLFFAHIVFGIFATLGYVLIIKKTTDNTET